MIRQEIEKLRSLEKFKVGDVVKLEEIFTNENKIEKTPDESKEKFYFSSNRIKGIFDDEYLALYKFDFVENLSEFEEAMFKKGRVNLNRKIKILEIGYIKIKEQN